MSAFTRPPLLNRGRNLSPAQNSFATAHQLSRYKNWHFSHQTPLNLGIGISACYQTWFTFLSTVMCIPWHDGLPWWTLARLPAATSCNQTHIPATKNGDDSLLKLQTCYRLAIIPTFLPTPAKLRELMSTTCQHSQVQTTQLLLLLAHCLTASYWAAFCSSCHLRKTATAADLACPAVTATESCATGPRTCIAAAAG